MRADTLKNLLPEADVTFVQLLARLPEPAPSAYPVIVRELRTLHGLYLRERDAATAKNGPAFSKILEQTADRLERIERETA